MSGETDQVKWRGVRPIYGIRGIWPAIDALRVNTEQSVLSGNLKILYTPAAGKILFLSSAALISQKKNVSTMDSKIRVRDGSDVNQFFVAQHRFEEPGQQETFYTFVPALEIEAAWDVIVESSSGDLRATAIIHGWIEDA